MPAVEDGDVPRPVGRGRADADGSVGRGRADADGSVGPGRADADGSVGHGRADADGSVGRGEVAPRGPARVDGETRGSGRHTSDPVSSDPVMSNSVSSGPVPSNSVSSDPVSSDPVLELLLDPERLSGLLRTPVRVTRVRPKPGVSHTAALLGADGRVLGWVQALVGPARAKAAKARDRAERYGHGALIGSLPLPQWDAELVWGGIATDPELGSPLRRSGLDLTSPDLVLLRYNPLRRLVVRVGGQVVRVTAEPHAQRMSAVARSLAERGLPVVAPCELGPQPHPGSVPPRVRVSRRVSAWPWVEGSDLTQADLGPVRAAGELAARVHATSPPVAVDLPERGWGDLLAAARRSVALLHAVAPQAAHAARLALAGLPEQEPAPDPLSHEGRTGAEDGRHVLLHGDLSLDQFLLGDDGVVRLTDLDRACWGPVELDLASVRAAQIVHEVRRSSETGGVGDSAVGHGHEQRDEHRHTRRHDHRYGHEQRDELRHTLRHDHRHGAAAWEAFVDGYGRAPLPGAWVSAALLARVAEPWRSQAAGWREQTEEVAQLALDLLAGTLLPGGSGGQHAQADPGGSAVVAGPLTSRPSWRVPRVVRARAEDESGDDDAVTVTVGRAWPAGARDGQARVAIEGDDGRGRLRAGTISPGGAVTLLPHGEDPRLPGLAAAARTGSLLVHRAGRRAVVHRADGYLKIVRPGRAAALVDASARGAAVARDAGLVAADVVSSTDETVLTRTLPGIPVQRLASDGSWSDLWAAWAAGWTRWQQLPPAGLAAHTPADEAQVLRTWAQRVGALDLLTGTPWPERLARVATQLDGSPDVTLVAAHRDLHDGQLLWDGRRVGVVDLDTVCRAEPALDLANLHVHAGLRQAQGLWPASAADLVREAVGEVAVAGSVPASRLALARRATVARLVAVYCLRPRWRDVVLAWAEEQWQSEARHG
ncbi:hypothetical protein AVL62_11225 [Serinicoccus chungangensis]|uniref:Aminoglycoside phosphotransferase domain-containing protein n=1 Tax=Serinicoccus chungangensis TaxID=767452 RepID=A0A0W8IEU1_9MICO|nr:hypothetical protein AVL62_11225 [Serinicoccus chungangensis]